MSSESEPRMKKKNVTAADIVKYQKEALHLLNTYQGLTEGKATPETLGDFLKDLDVPQHRQQEFCAKWNGQAKTSEKEDLSSIFQFVSEKAQEEVLNREKEEERAAKAVEQLRSAYDDLRKQRTKERVPEVPESLLQGDRNFQRFKKDSKNEDLDGPDTEDLPDLRPMVKHMRELKDMPGMEQITGEFLDEFEGMYDQGYHKAAKMRRLEKYLFQQVERPLTEQEKSDEDVVKLHKKVQDLVEAAQVKHHINEIRGTMNDMMENAAKGDLSGLLGEDLAKEIKAEDLEKIKEYFKVDPRDVERRAKLSDEDLGLFEHLGDFTERGNDKV
eukprot:TRINITY_DN2800_c0_g1_i2.p1 TRINITY_DN2800_c0_g1~~TRINITY_DN2800_c0_g1_i2.p1  ORF type:complete len:329 (+),score=110.56 TRINITY_DN2800_c0_g1_i2:584-1570(+)